MIRALDPRRAAVNRSFCACLPFLAALGSLGCGEVFRPIAQPIPLPSPTPAAAHFVASVSTNGVSGSGALSRIDVSGDSVVSVNSAGAAPVSAALIASGGKIYVANSGEDTISASSTFSSGPATTIALPQLCDASGCAASRPVFAATTENARVYVANAGSGTISVINTSSDVVVATVAVDPAFAGSPQPLPNRTANPVALTETRDGSKIYAVNQGTGTVTSISTVDDTVLKVITVGSSPVWAVSRSDSARVYVLDGSGTISVINTVSDAVISSSASAGAGANFMFYDAVFNRLYVTNPALAQVAIFDVSGDPPTPVAASPVAISAAPSSPCTQTPVPTALTVLADGSRAYVAAYQRDPSGSVCTQASVIDAGSGTLAKVIPISESMELAQTGCPSARFRVFAASSGGGANSNFKVYVSQCDAGSVAVIDTFAVN
ncbi:MAG: YncE family protein, partial [Acidobacteriales bacterium]|nr:YncE family protein [Terriglobales bacterium]